MYFFIHACPQERKWETERGRYLLFSSPAFARSPCSSAYLSGRKRESEASNFFGAVSRLFNLCVKYVYGNLSFSGSLAILQACDAPREYFYERYKKRKDKSARLPQTYNHNFPSIVSSLANCNSTTIVILTTRRLMFSTPSRSYKN